MEWDSITLYPDFWPFVISHLRFVCPWLCVALAALPSLRLAPEEAIWRKEVVASKCRTFRL